MLLKVNHIFIPVFTGSGDGTAMCFGSKSGTLLRTFKGHDVSVNAIQVDVQ